jgi:catechol 2,3-dioxygenase
MKPSSVQLNIANYPDGNGVELYCDRPRAEWPEGMVSEPLDVQALLAEALT